MAHEIMQNDKVMIRGDWGWHNLGINVSEAKSPEEALDIIDARDTVIQKPVITYHPETGAQVIVESHLTNWIDGKMVGMVSGNYLPVQNIDLARFCTAMAEVGDVQVETAGTIRNKAKIWMLCKAEQFEIGNKGDVVVPYVCVSNGHDGMSAFRVTPTTVRVVCSNTLHMVIPRTETYELCGAAFSARHTLSIMERVEEAREALKQFGRATAETKQVMETLRNKDVNSEQMKQFFLDCYQEALDQEIPTNPKNKVEERRREKAMSAYGCFQKRFDDEKAIAGATLWNMANAMSGLWQHDQKARGADDQVRVEKRIASNLFGLNARRTSQAFAAAYKLAQ